MKNKNMARIGKQNGMYGTTGMFAWRDLDGLSPHTKGEFNHTDESKNKISETKLSKTKFSDLSYSGRHHRVRTKYGQPQKCEYCGTDENRRYEWASISGEHLHIDDYISLCVPCHRAKDGNNTFGRRAN